MSNTSGAAQITSRLKLSLFQREKRHVAIFPSGAGAPLMATPNVLGCSVDFWAMLTPPSTHDPWNMVAGIAIGWAYARHRQLLIGA